MNMRGRTPDGPEDGAEIPSPDAPEVTLGASASDALRAAGSQAPDVAAMAAFEAPVPTGPMGSQLAAFEQDWTFDIDRDQTDKNIIRVLGGQTGTTYFETQVVPNGPSRKDNSIAWGEAEAARNVLRDMKLPTFTREKALEMETHFQTDTYYDRSEDDGDDRYTVVGYTTKFEFLSTTDRLEAMRVCEDLNDSKLPETDKTLQIQRITPLGEVQMLGSVLGASDPACGAGRVSVPAVQGAWEGFAFKKDLADWGSRNAVLLAVSKGYTPSPEDKWDEIGVVGVDAGVAALYDRSRFPEDWMDHSSSLDDGQLDDAGFVCSSGYGDGGYGAYAIKREGKAVAAGIVFLSPLERYDRAYLEVALQSALAQRA